MFNLKKKYIYIVCVYIYIYIHIHTHTYIHTCMHNNVLLLKGHCISQGYRDVVLCADIVYKDSGMNV